MQILSDLLELFRMKHCDVVKMEFLSKLAAYEEQNSIRYLLDSVLRFEIEDEEQVLKRIYLLHGRLLVALQEYVDTEKNVY